MPLIASWMAVGSLSGAIFSPSIIIIVIAWTAVLACALVSHIFSKRGARFAIVPVFAAAFALGLALSNGKILSVSNFSLMNAGEKAVACEALVAGHADVREWGGYVDVKLKGCGSGTARVSVGLGDADLLPGDRISFRAKFFKPREYKNPGVFSWRDYLIVHGIGLQGKVYGRIERFGNESFILSRIEKVRRRIADSVARHIEPPAERAIVMALAIGDQGDISPELRDKFANTGLAHLLAISGMNVAYVATFLYFLSRLAFGFFPWLLLRVPVQRLSAAVTIPAVWGYVLLTGSAISAIRAGIMITVYLFGILIGRRQDLLTTLAISVIAILLVLPLSVLDVSFQLSVAAVAGIILITPAFIRFLGGEGDRSAFRGRVLYWARALVSVSFAAGISTLPIVAYHFKLVSGIGFIANLIAVPMTGALLSPTVAIASVVSAIAPDAAPFLWNLSEFAARVFLEFTEFADRYGGFLVARFAPTIAQVFLFYAVVAVAALWKEIEHGKLAVAVLAAAICLNAGYRFVHSKSNDDLTVIILDVGQGDSSVIRFPDGRVMVIDGGGIKSSSFDIGRNVVAPALWKMGIYHIDWAVLTHPHHDHYRGLGFVVSEFKPEVLWTNGLEAPPDEEGGWEEFKGRVAESGARAVAVGDDGAAFDAGGAVVRLIKPPSPAGAELNDTSLIVDLKYGAQRFLITGDLSENGERRLLRGDGDWKADFLRVGHHGSSDATSREFLSAVEPAIAAISAGEHNQYGVPTKEILKRLEDAGAKIYRTDTDGAITVRSDGKAVTVETFVERR